MGLINGGALREPPNSEGVSSPIDGYRNKHKEMNDDEAKRLGVIGHDTRIAEMMEIHNASAKMEKNTLSDSRPGKEMNTYERVMKTDDMMRYDMNCRCLNHACWLLCAL